MDQIERAADRGQTARVLIYDNEVCHRVPPELVTDSLHLSTAFDQLYIKRFEWERHSRTRSSLALLNDAILTSTEPIPNVEFVIHTDDQVSAAERTQMPFVWKVSDFRWLTLGRHRRTTTFNYAQ